MKKILICLLLISTLCLAGCQGEKEIQRWELSATRLGKSLYCRDNPNPSLKQIADANLYFMCACTNNPAMWLINLHLSLHNAL